MRISMVRAIARMWALALVLFAAPTLACAEEIPAAGQAFTLQEQGGRVDYAFEDGAVRVTGVTSGTVTYDAGTRILKLAGVKMNGVYLYGGCDTLTVKLFGSNVGYGCFIMADASNNGDADVTITGTGSAQGRISGMNDLTVKGGTITATEYRTAVSCEGNLTMEGGSLTSKTDYGPSIRCEESLYMKGGTLAVEVAQVDNSSSSDPYCSIYCKGDLVSSGGELIETEGTDAHIFCAGKFSMSGGVVNVSRVVTRGDLTFAVGMVECGSLSLSKGSLNAACVRCSGDFVVTGDVNMTGAIDHCGGNITITGGTLPKGTFCDGNITLNGGEIKAPVHCEGNITLNGGFINTTERNGWTAVECNGNLTLNGGSITIANRNVPNAATGTLYCRGTLTVNGGRISLKDCDGTGIICTDLVLKKGSILVDGQYGTYAFNQSICITGGNLVMTGGTLTVTRSYKDAVHIESVTTGGQTYRDQTTPAVVHGGKATITGGTLTAQVQNLAKARAIVADGMSNQPSALKDIKGRIAAPGATFTAGGNTYRLFRTKGGAEGISLTRYNAKATRAKLDKVGFGGWTYGIRAVDNGAFATANGAKVVSATFKNSIVSVNSRAFKGARKLSSVSFAGKVSKVSPRAFDGAGQLVVVTFATDVTRICGKAFAGAKKLGKIRMGVQRGIQLDNNAFAGTIALTKLEFGACNKPPFAKAGKAAKWAKGVKVAKGAFSKCGKSGGKGLTVTFAKGGVPQAQAKAYRSLLIKHGMPKAFQLQIAKPKTPAKTR